MYLCMSILCVYDPRNQGHMNEGYQAVPMPGIIKADVHPTNRKFSVTALG